MKHQEVDLALAFLKSQPAAAANILEQQPLDQVAEFLSMAPPAYAAPVLEKLLPHYTARLLKTLDPSVAAGLLAELRAGLVAAIMRNADQDLARQLLEQLPEKTRIACRLLLNYSDEAVGAWMTPNIASLPDDCSAAAALERIATEADVIDSDAIHIVDRNRKLKGVVSVANLLRALPETPIAVVMEKNPYAISGRTALISATNHPGWDQRDTLPVINREHELVGALRHVDLRKGLNYIATQIVQPAGADPITGIIEMYGKSLVELCGTVTDVARVTRG